MSTELHSVESAETADSEGHTLSQENIDLVDHLLTGVDIRLDHALDVLRNVLALDHEPPVEQELMNVENAIMAAQADLAGAAHSLKCPHTLSDPKDDNGGAK